MVTMSVGNGLPSSAPVIARISKCEAIRLLPWPKFNWAVRNGVFSGSIGFAKVTVMCTGPDVVGSGDQPFSLRVSSTFSGRYDSSQLSAVTCLTASRRFRLTWSPGTDSELAENAVRTNVDLLAAANLAASCANLASFREVVLDGAFVGSV